MSINMTLQSVSNIDHCSISVPNNLDPYSCGDVLRPIFEKNLETPHRKHLINNVLYKGMEFEMNMNISMQSKMQFNSK